MINTKNIAIQQILPFLHTLLKSKGYESIKHIEYNNSKQNGDLEVRIPNDKYLVTFYYRKCKNPTLKNSKVRVSIFQLEKQETIPIFELEDPNLIEYLNQLTKRKSYFEKISRK